MKKIIVLLVAIISFSNSFGQNEKEGDKNEKGVCPEGQMTVITNHCDVFNFHRPKFDCQRGFWICTKGCTGWHFECKPYGSLLISFTVGKYAFIWGRIIESKVELHFPIALKENPEYTKEDLEYFSVDEDDTFYKDEKTSYTMAQGQYKVNEVEKELVVLVDLK